MRLVWRCLIALLAIWALDVGAIFVIQWSRPTPLKFANYVASHPLSSLDSAHRAAVIHHTAALLNGLNLQQRDELKKTGALRNFFLQLTAGERRTFLAATLPEGLHQMIAALNKMDPEQRKKLALRTLRDLRSHSTEAEVLTGDQDLRVLLSQGFSTFNDEADAQVKLDFAPVLEELQRKPEPAATNAAPLKF